MVPLIRHGEHRDGLVEVWLLPQGLNVMVKIKVLERVTHILLALKGEELVNELLSD